MVDQLNKSQLQDVNECFFIYAQNGALALERLGDALRSLGWNPSNAEVQRMIKNTSLQDPIQLQDFLALLQSQHMKVDEAEEIRESFGVLDRDGSGLISASELRHVLTNMGEKLSQEEVEMILKHTNKDPEGRIQCEELIDIIKQRRDVC